MNNCEGCDGTGYRVATRAEDALVAIERCDTCEVFECDEDARNHLMKTSRGKNPGKWLDAPLYIDIESDAPCYLCVWLDGVKYRLSTGGTP